MLSTKVTASTMRITSYTGYCCASIPLSIHVLIKVASQLFLMTPPRILYLCFYFIPIALYILSVGTSDGIHKFNGVIDSAVGADI